MSFVERIVGPDETLLGVSHVHWICGLKGFCWFLLGVASGLFLEIYVFGNLAVTFHSSAFLQIGRYALYAFTGMGLLMFIFYLMVLFGTEIALTTRRIIFKRGIFATDVKEVDLEEIKAADVNNGWFGRFLNYGYLIFDARFVTNMQLPAVHDPYRFVKALNETRSHIKTGDVENMLKNTEQGDDSKKLKSTAYSIDDPRYYAMEEDPIKEMRHIADELAIQEAPNTKPAPDKRAARGSASGAKVEKAAERYQPEIFRKGRLRERVKNTFQMIANYKRRTDHNS